MRAHFTVRRRSSSIHLALIPVTVWLALSPAVVARLFSRTGTLAPDTVAAIGTVRAVATAASVVVAVAASRPGLRPWVARLVLVATSTLASLAAAELALRAAGIDFDPRARPVAVYRPSADPRLGWELAPGAVAVRKGVVYRVNEQGFRGAPWPAACRVLVVGDSIVYGDDVAEDALIGARLGRALGVPVVAAGVGGYNTAQERRLVELLVPRLRPERVIVVFCFNDVDDPRRHVKTTKPLPLASIAPAPFGALDLVDLVLRRYSRLYVGFRIARVARRPARGGQALPDESTDWEHCLRDLSDPGTPAARWLGRELAELAACARAAKVSLEVAVVPLPCQLPPRSRLAGDPQRTLAALCAAAGLPCRDLFPDFAKHEANALFVDACHLSAEGHRVAAAALAREVE